MLAMLDGIANFTTGGRKIDIVLKVNYGINAAFGVLDSYIIVTFIIILICNLQAYYLC